MSVKSPKFPSEESDISFILSAFPDDSFLVVTANAFLCNKINFSKYKYSVNVKVASNPEWTFSEQDILKNGLIFEYFLLADIIKNLPSNKLTIHCVIYILTDKAIHNLSFNVPKCDLANDLENLFDSKELSDVIIKTSDGHELRAHKNILSGMLNIEKTLCCMDLLIEILSPLLARSPVFAAMFKHPMLENQENIVAIDDFKHDVVAEMLRFIYTGYAPKLPEMSEDLLAAADKYAIERLKQMCGGYLSDNLSVRTAPGVLKLTDLYNMPKLKMRSIQFIENLLVCNTIKLEELLTTLYEVAEKKKENFQFKQIFPSFSKICVIALGMLLCDWLLNNL